MALGLLGALGAAAGVAAFGPGSPRIAPAVDPAAGIEGRVQIIGERCFAPGTPVEVMQEVGVAIYGLGQRFFTAGRWPGTTNTPVNLTYSFPPDGTLVDQGTNILNATLNAQFASQGGTAQWKSLFRQVFDAWEAVTGNRYTEVSDDGASWPGNAGIAGVRGDVRICARNIDGPSNTLAFDFFPGGGGDMMLDAQENWAATFANFRFLRNVAMHEHGHGSGLQHVCPISNSKLMEPFYSANYDGPQQDDMRGMHSLYGDPLEPNNNTATATDLDARNPPLTLNIPLDISNVSINGIGDSDLFKFVAPPNATISVTVTPQGTTYLNGPQNGDGSCSAGSALDAKQQQDLAIDILNAGGGAVFTKNDNGLGQGEMITNFNLGAAATFYVRVRSAGGPGNVQMYFVSFTRRNIGVTGDLNGDGCVNSTDLGILLGSWGPSMTSADLNGDGVVNASDLAILLGAWGAGCGM